VKHNRFSFSLFVLMMILIACKPETTTVEVSGSQAQPPVQVASNVEQTINENSCNHPANASTCAALVEQILATTVRIELRRWLEEEGKRGDYIDGGIGHATVKDGRYLVTHNHFGIPLDSIEGIAGEQIRISVYRANGDIILDNVRPSAFSIVAQDSEAVVLDFGAYAGDGLFAMLGIPSAQFQNWQSLSLVPGMEVAQINWDNETAHVEWVNIKSVTTRDGTPRIVLDYGVIKGASGGGIFWNGFHIGNNWTSTKIQMINDGTVLDAFSAAALNSDLVLN
jgi:hypothetical protein